MKLSVKMIACLLLASMSVSAQMNDYHYKRELSGNSEQWHKIILPDDFYGKVLPGLTDVRIYGITPNHDTIEAPYILRLTSESTTEKEVVFRLINTSFDKNGYYFTFAVPSNEPVNQIHLHFRQQNFDWQVRLEGGFNQSDWQTITDHYRILSIKNESTDFQFTRLVFPNAKYRYFRLMISGKEKPDLISASIIQQSHSEGKYKEYSVSKMDITNNKVSKQTEIDIDMGRPVPLCRLKLNVQEKFDYYRPIEISYVTDSIQTEQGVQYNYSYLTSGMLTSLEESLFGFNSTILKRLKIVIYNHDNQPLHIDTIKPEGYIHELAVQFITPAKYYLVYGNRNAIQPSYEIEQFMDRIPTALSPLKLGKEILMSQNNIQKATPIFQNKLWLWIIMGVIMVTLGWFSIKMLQKK